MLRARGRMIELAERRARLSERARAEREVLAAAVARTDGASRVVAGMLAGGRRVLDEIRRQPLIAAAAVALLVALRPRRALGWAMKGWSAWRLYRGARRWWQSVTAGPDGSSPVR